VNYTGLVSKFNADDLQFTCTSI